MKSEKLRSKFVLCVRNQGAEDLETRKVYQVLPDGDLRGEYVRVIDESGEDYLYPAEYFVPLKLPVAIVRELGSPSNGARYRAPTGPRQRSVKLRSRASRRVTPGLLRP
jgi:hypothetical protein